MGVDGTVIAIVFIALNPAEKLCAGEEPTHKVDNESMLERLLEYLESRSDDVDIVA